MRPPHRGLSSRAGSRSGGPACPCAGICGRRAGSCMLRSKVVSMSTLGGVGSARIRRVAEMPSSPGIRGIYQRNVHRYLLD
jgi:hypothetical protein